MKFAIFQIRSEDSRNFITVMTASCGGQSAYETIRKLLALYDSNLNGAPALLDALVGDFKQITCHIPTYATPDGAWQVTIFDL